MMMENQRVSLVDEDDGDRFPVGMRVLAVDDDRTCLKVLENMLRSCQYHVTTTTQSINALAMLRKHRNSFDIVISDVDMPDMDGFKLLEQVGLEMDLPVIMLSGHNDKKLVMKGVMHGACDYLLKPVRIEELQNIWQHVVRKKIDRKDQNNKAANVENACNLNGEGSQGIASENNADEIIKPGQKRKEHSEDEEEDDEDYGPEDEEPSTQKKRRLVWVTELHRKFVAAVNQLGLENAVPKKILDLMNVEGLTRENVASHLQKFRLGLKKATQQANKVAALGTSDPYLQMGSIDGYRDFRTSAGSRRISSTTLPSYPSGICSRLNLSSSLSLRGISPSALVQRPVQSQNMNSSIKTLQNFQLSMISANQCSSSVQGIPTSIELDQFQQSNRAAGIRQLSPIGDSSGFTVSSGFPDCKATIGNANDSLSGLSSNHLLSQGNSAQTHNSGTFRNHPSLGAAAMNTKSFDTGIWGSSNLLEYNESWQSAAQLSNFPANSLPWNETFNNDELLHSSVKFSSSTSHIGNSLVDSSSTSAVAVPLEDARGELQSQEGLLGNIVQASCSTQQQSWEDHKQDYSRNMTSTMNSINSLVSPIGDTSSLGHIKSMDESLVGQLNGATPSIAWCAEVEKLCDATMKLKDACILPQMKSQGLIHDSFGYFDDTELHGQTGAKGEDAYPVGSCIDSF